LAEAAFEKAHAEAEEAHAATMGNIQDEAIAEAIAFFEKVSAFEAEMKAKLDGARSDLEAAKAEEAAQHQAKKDAIADKEQATRDAAAAEQEALNA